VTAIKDEKAGTFHWRALFLLNIFRRILQGIKTSEE